MNKLEAVHALGQDALLRPALLREALKANDRLKLALTVLQAAVDHALAPDRPVVDLSQEIAAADIRDRIQVAWWRELPARSHPTERGLKLPDVERLAAQIAADLGVMARPLLEGSDVDPCWAQRLTHWQTQLAALASQDLDEATISELTHGRRAAGDSLHLLVMDMHKALNRLAVQLDGEDVAGAHAWGLAPDGGDRARVEAFMRGLARTRHLKGDHPGLDTCATRDGERLLIQNDIGTNDAHVLVLQVRGLAMSLTYSDLHKARFAFFQRALEACGAQWSDVASTTHAGLNQGAAYHVGTARWSFEQDEALDAALEAVGSRIVFLIDWNHARKRLRAFVDKSTAVQVLDEAARQEVGHRAWIEAGGERLVWDAMAAQGDGHFRLGDRLDEVLGPEAARTWLGELLALAAQAQRDGQPMAWVADEARVRLARLLRGGGALMPLLREHAAWCHTLAQALRDGLAHGAATDAGVASKLASRAKVWEREADDLVEQARSRAQRHPGTRADAELMQSADDVADCLEEACFSLSLLAEVPGEPWGARATMAMQALADSALSAVQEHVKAVEVLSAGEASPSDDALEALWRVVQAERQCDECLRRARRELAREARDGRSLLLGQEVAGAMEKASDHLLTVGHALRRRVLDGLRSQE